MSNRRVVITGMGAITPLGCSVEAFWDGLLAGRSGIKPLQLFECATYETRFAGQCLDFDPSGLIEFTELMRLDGFAQFAGGAAIPASRYAGLDIAAEDPFRIGAIVGSGIGGINEFQTQTNRLRDKGPSKVSAFTIPKLMLNAGSGNITIYFGVRGPSTGVATACASATNAMADALRIIQRGEADVMFTGGSEAAVTELSVAAFNAMHALSTNNANPSGASRPFDRNRDGFVLSEGAGVLIFEELEHARKRGARIHAEVLGAASSSDGGHITQPNEHGTGAAQAMRDCLRDSGVNPEDLDYINAHGTSTPLGDLAETKAVKAVFGDKARKLAISSTKSSVGHLLGASGGVELIATVMAIASRTAPPTINLLDPDPQCDLDYIPNTARDMLIRRAMSNSFGFGGHNACILVGRFDG